ncbi:nucleoside-diphosphate-sugar epimerase [Hypoxylon trugodes]|uniref:nucleoside-diphosphate-sugar epimerase n=1 Tax=Hypoxylon trugodes TaxID=326681 RepID=UPI0021A0DCB7|nr:nucleoside-diphosphate-sugar epimerase [Hypoxylon trugodes]KAI1390438.1 nucleoside-diphosphate-sugar epimerase [Hypoxylon trugodes]
MKILITGAGGFIGQFLAREFLKDPSNQLVLTDIVNLAVPKGSLNPQNAKLVKADLSQDQSVITKDLSAVYLFHGIMSSGSESNFDLGLRVNLFTTLRILEAIRQVAPGIRVIYASSEAVYGRPYPEIITEDIIPTPEGSYGAQKLMCEVLINDMTRKGFIDGLSLRLPTISVRPGSPTAAATSFVSGIIREPVQGKECVVPIKDRSFPSWVCSPKTLIVNLIHALALPSDALPSHKRAINAPGLLVTIQDMMDALAKVCGEDKLLHIKEVEDPELGKILHSFAWKFNNKLALSLGFRPDTSFENAVRDYVEFLEFEKNPS